MQWLGVIAAYAAEIHPKGLRIRGVFANFKATAVSLGTDHEYRG